MKRSVLLRALLLLSMKPLFQITSNTVELVFETHPEVSVEGQFLASLAPLRSTGGGGCACAPEATDGDAARLPRGGAEMTREGGWEGDERHGGQFWRVMLHDDDEHTLDYAIDTVPRPPRWQCAHLLLRMPLALFHSGQTPRCRPFPV